MMQDDTHLFVGMTAALPWLILAFFSIEIIEAGYVQRAVAITAVVSLIVGLVSFIAYTRVTSRR